MWNKEGLHQMSEIINRQPGVSADLLAKQFLKEISLYEE